MWSPGDAEEQQQPPSPSSAPSPLLAAREDEVEVQMESRVFRSVRLSAAADDPSECDASIAIHSTPDRALKVAPQSDPFAPPGLLGSGSAGSSDFFGGYDSDLSKPSLGGGRLGLSMPGPASTAGKTEMGMGASLNIFDEFAAALEPPATSSAGALGLAAEPAAPELAHGYYDRWSSVVSPHGPQQLMEALRDVLHTPDMATDARFSPSSYVVGGVAIRDGASATYAIHIFRFNDQHHLIEFQRRSGDRAAFRIFFNDAAQRLKAAGYVSDDLGNCGKLHGLTAALPPPPEDQTAAELAEQLDALLSQGRYRTDALLQALRVAREAPLAESLAEHAALVTRCMTVCCEVLAESGAPDAQRVAATLLATAVAACPAAADTEFSANGRLTAVFRVLTSTPAPEEAFLHLEVKRQLCSVVQVLARCPATSPLLRAYNAPLRNQLTLNCTDAALSKALQDILERIEA